MPNDHIITLSSGVEEITWLFKKEDDFEVYWVGYEIKPEQLIISDYQSGQSLKDSWGDEDLEHYVHIKREDVPAFISACCTAYNLDAVSDVPNDEEIKKVLHAAFERKRKMIFEVKDILKANDIPYQFQMW